MALRLAFSMSGGGAISLLKSAALRLDPDRLVLTLPAGSEALYGEAVKRRLEALGRGLDKPVSVETGAAKPRRRAAPAR